MDAVNSDGQRPWWEKRKAILEWLRIHPSTAQELKHLFPNDEPDPVLSDKKSLDAASHCLKRIWKRKKLKRVGYEAKLCGGRPLFVYCCHAIKADLVDHELGLTRFFQLYPKAQIKRGYDVDPKLRPDGEMTLKARVLIEWVTEHTKIKAFLERLKQYESYKGPVIWVCPDGATAERLREVATRVENNSFFGTISDARANPHGEIWKASDGRIQDLQNPVEKPSETPPINGGSNVTD